MMLWSTIEYSGAIYMRLYRIDIQYRYISGIKSVDSIPIFDEMTIEDSSNNYHDTINNNSSGSMTHDDYKCGESMKLWNMIKMVVKCDKSVDIIVNIMTDIKINKSNFLWRIR